LACPPRSTGRTASPPVTYDGNPALRAELADTSTLGVSWERGGARVTLDGWHIRVDRAIGFPIEQATLNDCVDAADGPGRTAACGAISRDLASGQIVGLRARYTNIGRIDTAGIDLAADWRVTGHSGRCGRPVGHRDLGRPGWPSTPMPLRGRRAARRHPPNPRLRASLGARWSSQRLTLDWQARLIGSARITGETIHRPSGHGLRSYHDLGAALRLASGTLRLDVANVFDAAPPRRGYQTSQDRRRRALSNLGRIVRLGATATF
jgi:outer membrane receptor protein involved in Fe transport